MNSWVTLRATGKGEGVAGVGSGMSIPELDAVIDRAIADEVIAGTVVLVARDGEVVHERAAGFADLAEQRPMRVDHLLRYASLTKPITALTTMALVERGTLDLTSPVTRWLPSFRPRLADGTEPAITVDRLLTHTAGLTYGFGGATGEYAALGISDGMDLTDLTLAEEVERIGRSTLLFPPGAAWAYSVAYDVLGGLAEAATGSAFPDVVAELVTGPLGMSRAAFAVAPTPDLATAYQDGRPPTPIRDGVPVPTPDGGPGLLLSPSRIFDADQFPSGGGGMVGDAAGFLRLLEAVRTGGAGVLRPETVEGMLEPRVKRPVAPGVSGAFGRGWAVITPRETTPLTPGSVQWGGVYGNAWAIDRERRVSVVQLTNTSLAGMAGPFPDAVLEAALAG